VAGSSSSGAALAPGVLAFSQGLDEAGLRAVLLTSGHDNGSRAVILPFRAGCPQPVAVFKVSTHADFNANTEREQASLAEMRARLPAAMRQTIPQPLGLLRHGDLMVGVETCATGHPLLVTSGRWRASFQQQLDDLRLAANWLTEFHRQGQAGRCEWSAEAIERWIETPLATYARTFGLTPGEERLFAEVRRRARLVQGASLPLVWMHYDFAPWNLYRQGNDFTVIDWEFGRDWERDRAGPALYDLLYFVTYWHHVVRRLHTGPLELEGQRALFVRPGRADRYASAVHQALADYLAALEIDGRFLPLVLVYLWIEQALHQFSRKRLLGHWMTDARSANRCTQYLGVLAADVEAFFAACGQRFAHSAGPA
jgi:hypothetical protein